MIIKKKNTQKETKTNVVDFNRSRQTKPEEQIPEPVFASETPADTNPLIAERQLEQLKVFKNTQPLSNLLVKAREIQEQCSDVRVQANSITMSDDLKVSSKYLDSQGRLQEFFNSNLSSYAFGQLLNKSGMDNVKYAKKCIERGYEDLVATNVNRYLDDCDKNLLIRKFNDDIRGVVTDKYSILDTPDIIQALSDTLGNDYKVKEYMLNEERFHARLLQSKMLNVPNEDLFAGLQIDSSDIGRSILTVKFFIFKQVCTNGMIASQGDSVLFEQKHIGIKEADFRRGLEESLDLIDPLVAKYKAIITDAGKTKLSRKQMDALLEEVVAKLDISEKAVAKVISLAEQRYGKTQWGVINGLTELAQDYTLERRLEIEQYAGNLLQVV